MPKPALPTLSGQCPEPLGGCSISGVAAHAYAHVVFTLPHERAPLALQNKRVVYDLLFTASSATLIEVARNPERLGADIGFFSVLHTWNQKLEQNPHS
jgi:hypothetical protein